VRKLFWLFCWLIPASAYAADPATVPPPVFSSLVQVVLALILVLGAILVSAWLVRRFGPTNMTSNGAMRVLGGVMVGQRERLMLVEVGETWLVVGVAPGRVTPVHSMPRPPQAELLNQDPMQHPSFADWLKNAWHKRSGA